MNLFFIDSFVQVFRTEADCEDYLMKKRWSNGFCCPNCDNDTFYKIQTRNLLECKECRVQVSLTAGTIMHKSKLPLLLWFQAIKALVQNSQTYTITSFAELLGINYRTAKLLIYKIQLALNKEYLRLGSIVLKYENLENGNNKIKHSPTRKDVVNLHRRFFKNSRNITYSEDILFSKWMNAFLSVRLSPIFLKYYQVI